MLIKSCRQKLIYVYLFILTFFLVLLFIFPKVIGAQEGYWQCVINNLGKCVLDESAYTCDAKYYDTLWDKCLNTPLDSCESQWGTNCETDQSPKYCWECGGGNCTQVETVGYCLYESREACMAVCSGSTPIPTTQPTLIPTPTEKPPTATVAPVNNNVDSAIPRYRPWQKYPFPCNKVAPENSIPYKDPEFHSLRPYQESPCNPNKEDLAIYCGNDLILYDDVTGSYSSNDPRCHQIGDGKVRCDFKIERQTDIAVDLSGASFPIMGNTELVVNSQNQPNPEGLDDAEKVNEYVSWYLNGVIGRAEYPPLDTDSEEDNLKITDYSGPLNKLLPWEIQARGRIETIEKAKKERHDQVIGCANLLGRITECYPQRAGVKRIRISDIKKPPLPSDFKKFNDYWLAYQDWRGKTCAKFFGLAICLNNPLKPDYFANLFTYIPLSSTEDRKGEVDVTKAVVTPASPDVTISNVSIKTEPADLFFAHMQESKELAQLLQKTYVPQEQIDNLSIDPRTISVEGSNTCSLRQVRSNPGDNLFAGEIKVDLKYTAEFSCDFDLVDFGNPTSSPVCSTMGGECYPDEWRCSGGRFDCPKGYTCANRCREPEQNLTCTKTAQIGLSTVTKTPLADEVWSRFVAGTVSVFRRIFPKLGPGGPLEAVLDIPGATKVRYTSSSGKIYAGNPGERSGESAELYFPHIGGIHEYFLHAIQTALRPKGYGYSITSGKPGSVNIGDPLSCDRPATPPDAQGGSSCGLGAGYCSFTNLKKYFGSDKAAKQASIICNAESGGDPSNINCGCLSGKSSDYSIGLFQINLLAHCANNAIEWSKNPISCTVKDATVVKECSETFFKAEENIKYAASLSGDGSNWNPWSVYLLTNAEGGCREQIDAVQ